MSALGFVVFGGLLIGLIVIPLMAILLLFFRLLSIRYFPPLVLFILCGIQLTTIGFDVFDWKNHLESPKVILSADATFGRLNESLLFFRDGNFIHRSEGNYRRDDTGKYYFEADTIRLSYFENFPKYPLFKFCIFDSLESGLYLKCFYKKGWQIESYSFFYFDIGYFDEEFLVI